MSPEGWAHPAASRGSVPLLSSLYPCSVPPSLRLRLHVGGTGWWDQGDEQAEPRQPPWQLRGTEMGQRQSRVHGLGLGNVGFQGFIQPQLHGFPCVLPASVCLAVPSCSEHCQSPLLKMGCFKPAAAVRLLCWASSLPFL